MAGRMEGDVHHPTRKFCVNGRYKLNRDGSAMFGKPEGVLRRRKRTGRVKRCCCLIKTSIGVEMDSTF